uniref:CTP synthase n=1 Tax=Pyramimonas obovata TaxID=1411642 RepID=A0A7S0RFG2_9CHLO|mmetsp:Transcript_32303/g.70490  ORF Transcript_32303/g.70490 Transcript_32303/m.70490 type:complete len:566 (+) Transcript_32303:117-1814(+)|eukprot:CAMPEP_0118929026 /NCGR_PEP_ID=MMETSP1169-20130426/6143_1 /TAXON_ID=36882 /ORGANISM="Pyramimonas obovata, Strain CCMP722" /LENGTH=565 /DNA_ID=CAMNT_0006871141 /DNA_START=114 /DNA_END=1811 /DNA_ORIENTATION=-
MKYVLVTGGVVSGLGKGVTASSIGVLLQASGLRVTSIKIDPYLNTDAGTMSPFEHGEVFVLDDGGEVDLDLGNYERFLDIRLTKDNNITTGKIYNFVIERERRGDYLGKTVQVVPHVTDAIQDWVERVSHIPVDGNDGVPDVCVIELGGTVGDIESAPFVEALRQFQFRVGPSNFCLIHVSLVPVLGVVGEQKTKPTQHTVQVLRSLGLSPNLLACRSTMPLEGSVREKISSFCHVPPSNVLNIHDCSNIWHVPLLLKEQGAEKAIMTQLGLAHKDIHLEFWKKLAVGWDNMQDMVRIAMVGKYTNLSDAYLSVTKSLQHACFSASRKLQIMWIDASDLEETYKERGGEYLEKYNAAWATLKAADGILVPGGFGDRGVEGKISAAKYARESRTPYLGICLGMQVTVIEFCRSKLGMDQAQSMEFNPATPHPVVVFMPEGSTTHMGGTMRLGTRRTVLQTVECITAKLYQSDQYIDERHRHRYEVNPELVEKIEAAGMVFVGKDETGRRMEIVELEDHPYFVATQFHPEFKSRPGKPSPVFLGLVLAATGQLDSYLQGRKINREPK